MLLGVAFTQADLDKLDAAIAAAGGVQGVTFSDGQTMNLHGVTELRELRAMMLSDIDASASPPRNIRYAVTSKGT